MHVLAGLLNRETNRIMETECCSIYTANSSGRQWKKPDEVMKLRKNRSSFNMKRTPQKRALVTTLSPKPPKPNPFKTKSSQIKQLEKENKISSHGNLLKVCVEIMDHRVYFINSGD